MVLDENEVVWNPAKSPICHHSITIKKIKNFTFWLRHIHLHKRLIHTFRDGHGVLRKRKNMHIDLAVVSGPRQIMSFRDLPENIQVQSKTISSFSVFFEFFITRWSKHHQGRYSDWSCTLENFLGSYLNDTKTKISFLPHSPYDRHMVYWHRCIFECILVYYMTSSLDIWYLNTCTLHIWLTFHFPNSWYDVDPKTVYPTNAFMEFVCFHSANHWLNLHCPFYISQPIQIKISEGRLSKGMWC